jgi:hypothetical protein
MECEMNQQQRAVVQQALEALELHCSFATRDKPNTMDIGIEAMNALRQLLEQPEPVQEPSYWLGYGLQAHTEKPFKGATPLYTTPPIVATPLAQPAAWVGLMCGVRVHCHTVVISTKNNDAARQLCMALLEKNGGA